MVQNVGYVQSEIKLLIAQRMPKLLALNFNEEMLDFYATGIAGSKIICMKTGQGKINRVKNFVLVLIHLNGCNETCLQVCFSETSCLSSDNLHSQVSLGPDKK